jgi:hypothetical protein
MPLFLQKCQKSQKIVIMYNIDPRHLWQQVPNYIFGHTEAHS